MKFAYWGLTALLALPAGIAVAQSQQDQAPAQQSQQAQQAQPPQQKPDALAEAARHARDQKKDQAKAAKVWDNDTISSASGTVNVVGQAAAPADNTAAPATADQGAAAPAGQANAAGAPAKPQDNAAINADLTAAKEKLQSVQKDLDLLQRKFTLDQQTFLSNPNHDSDPEGVASLKNQQGQISSKQQEVADAQKAVDDLQAKLNAAGGSSGTQPQ